MGRRGGSPTIVAASLVVTLSMALAVLWQWAEVQRTVDAEPTIAAPADPTVGLDTPVLSLRRAPAVLSRHLNSASFESELEDLLGEIGATSCVTVAVDGRLIATKNPLVPVIPASTLKVVVAAVALEVLGPGFTFQTTVVGEVGADGVVAGDLGVVGGGDPVLSTHWWPASGLQAQPPINITSLESLADGVQAAGVTFVAGSVVGDGSRYDDEFFAPSWDASLRVNEAGPYDALLVNDGWVTTSLKDVTSDPSLGSAQVFAALLRERGIRVGGGAIAGVTEFGTEIASVSSLPLADIVAEMLLTSDDNTAEMLVKEIGLEVLGQGTTAAGTEAIMTQLLKWEVPIDNVLIVDGSGLSRDNRLTCTALVGVLHHGVPTDSLGLALPIAAVSGTLTDSFVGTEVSGRLLAKTGSLTDVKALGGYLPVDGGGTVEFALVINEVGIEAGGYVRLWEDLLAPALASYPSAAATSDLSP